jgi:hypothetical protein
MLKSLRLPIAVGVLALGLPFGLIATSANAATITSASAGQPSFCGWRPGNDSGQDAHVFQTPLNIRTGQSTQCNQIGVINSTGDDLTVHCQTTNSAGYVWDYITDNATHVTGWVYDGDVNNWWGPPQNC